MDLLERLKYFLDKEDISYRKLEEKIGTSNGTISKATKQHKSISHKSVEKILQEYPQLSAEWLMRNNGEMIKPQQLYVNGNNNISNISNTGDIVNVGSCSKEEIIEVLKEVKDKQEEILKILLTQRKK